MYTFYPEHFQSSNFPWRCHVSRIQGSTHTAGECFKKLINLSWTTFKNSISKLFKTVTISALWLFGSLIILSSRLIYHSCSMQQLSPDNMANDQAIHLGLSLTTLFSACFTFCAASMQNTRRQHLLQLCICDAFLLPAAALIILTGLQLQDVMWDWYEQQKCQWKWSCCPLTNGSS